METTPEDVDESPAADRRGTSPVVIAALAALLGILAGFVIGYVTANPAYPGEDSAEAGFARDMSVHHGQAVQLGMIAYDRATRQDVRAMAYDIATSQQAQIGIMTTWLDQWNLPKGSRGPAMAWMPHGEHMLLPDGRMRGMASPEQIAQLRTADGTEVDRLFCQLMITHHQSGVHMAEAVLKATDNPEVQELAQGMVNAQQKEIQTLTDVLKELGTPT